MGTATYKADGQVYEIPDNEKESFIKDIPHAEEVQSFTAGKDTFDIPLKEVPDFVKDMPEAKPLKKKDLAATTTPGAEGKISDLQNGGFPLPGSGESAALSTGSDQVASGAPASPGATSPADPNAPITPPTGLPIQYPTTAPTLRQREVELLKDKTAQVFANNPIFQDPATRDMYYKKLSEVYTPDEMKGLIGDDYERETVSPLNPLSSVSSMPVRTSPITGKEEFVHKPYEALKNPLGTIGMGVMEGLESSGKKLSESAAMIEKPNPEDSDIKTGLKATLHATQGAVEGALSIASAFVPPLMAFNLGASLAKDIAPKATEALLAPVSSSLKNVYGDKLPTWAQDAGSLADLAVGILVFHRGAKAIKGFKEGFKPTPADVKLVAGEVEKMSPDQLDKAVVVNEARKASNDVGQQVESLHNDIQNNPDLESILAPKFQELQGQAAELHDNLTNMAVTYAADEAHKSTIERGVAELEARKATVSDAGKEVLDTQIQELKKQLEPAQAEPQTESATAKPEAVNEGVTPEATGTNPDNNGKEQNEAENRQAERKEGLLTTDQPVGAGEIPSATPASATAPGGNAELHPQKGYIYRVTDNALGATGKDISFSTNTDWYSGEGFLIEARANGKNIEHHPESKRGSIKNEDITTVYYDKNGIATDKKTVEQELHKMKDRFPYAKFIEVEYKEDHNGNHKLYKKIDGSAAAALSEANTIATDLGYDHARHLLNAIKKETGNEYKNIQDIPEDVRDKFSNVKAKQIHEQLKIEYPDVPITEAETKKFIRTNEADKSEPVIAALESEASGIEGKTEAELNAIESRINEAIGGKAGVPAAVGEPRTEPSTEPRTESIDDKFKRLLGVSKGESHVTPENTPLAPNEQRIFDTSRNYNPDVIGSRILKSPFAEATKNNTRENGVLRIRHATGEFGSLKTVSHGESAPEFWKSSSDYKTDISKLGEKNLQEIIEGSHNDKQRSAALSEFIASRLLQKTDSFSGKILNRLRKERPAGSDSVAIIEGLPAHMSPLSSHEGRVLINVDKMLEFYKHFDNFEHFKKGLDIGLSEEVIHLVGSHVATEAELTAIGKELTAPELDALETLYGTDISGSDYHKGGEYLRLLMQEVLHGTATEFETKIAKASSPQLKIGVRKILAKALAFLQKTFAGNPSRLSNEVIGRMKKFINEEPLVGVTGEGGALNMGVSGKSAAEMAKAKTAVSQLRGEHSDSEISDMLRRNGFSEREVGSALEVHNKPTEAGITHEETAKIRDEFSLNSYEKSTKTKAELESQADELLKSGYNIESLISKLEDGKLPSDIEQTIMKRYLSGLADKLEKNPMDSALLEQSRRAVQASDKIGGSEVGRSLQARKGLKTRDETLLNYFMEDQDVNLDAPLTDQQKTTVIKEYTEIKEAKEALEKKLQDLEDQFNKDQARKEVEKTIRTSRKGRKTTEEHIAYRKKISEDIGEKLRKMRSEMQSTIVPYARELTVIAPDVAKLMKDHIEEKVERFEDIVDKIHETLKTYIPDVTKQDVQDVIAGKYNEPKRTRNEAAKKLYELRQQAKLTEKLSNLVNGIEPTIEKKIIQRNQEIEALRKQVKEHDLTKLAEYKNRLRNQIEKIDADLKSGNIAPDAPKPSPKLDSEALKLKDAYIKRKQERELRLLKQKYANRSAYERAKEGVMEVLNVPRTIMSSLDFSAPLRQGIIATVAHPRIASRAFQRMFSYAVSQRRFDRWFHDIKNNPLYEMSQEAGLYLSDPHDPRLSVKEEAFMNNLAEKIPVAGKLIKASERAYVGYLNRLRWDLFRHLSQELASQGKTFENNPKLYKGLADYVNNSTGRGKLHPFLEGSAPVLNSAFFAPRLIASRLNFLNPIYYAKLPKEVRIRALKDVAKFIGVGLSVMALAKLSGAQVESDPRSSDFGKIKSGNTRWDIWGGHQQYIRTLYQLYQGEEKNTETGKIKSLFKKDGFSKDRGDVILHFFRGKLAPVPSFATDYLKGKTIVGDDFSWMNEAQSHLTPLLYNDVKEAISDRGIKSIFSVGVPSMFGVGVQTYNTKKIQQSDQ